MSKYKILRWDAILASDGINLQPVIYIRPDIDFVRFSYANDGVVEVQISETGKNYDLKRVVGVVNKPGEVMPNYFNSTQQVVITLSSEWLGYPLADKLGNAAFFGLRQ